MKKIVLALALILIAIALFAVLTSYAMASQAAPPPAVRPRLIPNTDLTPYGANFFLEREVEEWKREKTMRMAKEAGIGWAKQHFPWEEIEPRRKGEFVWDKYDHLVDLYEKYGLQIIARLDRPPDWSRADNTLKTAPPDRFTDYGDFVYAFITHYKGRIRYVQIWNEPNIYPEWGNGEVSPSQYVELLKIAYRRAKEADPNVSILSAPLAINVENFPFRRNLSDLIYLDEMYQQGAKEFFDIYLANAFGMDRPPEDPPDPNVLNFSRVLLQRQIMEKYGDGDKPVWFNEYGWNASPADFPKDALIWQRVSEEDQARYTVEAIEEAREKWPWAGVFNIWYFRQVGNIPPDRSDYYFRMVDVDFTPRLVYYAVQKAAARPAVATVGMYQETNPAVTHDAHWTYSAEPLASGEANLASESPAASLSFTFEGDAVDLITLKGPQEGRLQVALDDHPIAELPRDQAGLSFVDLFDEREQWQEAVPIVQGAGSGQHVLRLVVSPALSATEGAEKNPRSSRTHVTVDGFVVKPSSGQPFPYATVAMLGLAFIVAAGLLVSEMRQR